MTLTAREPINARRAGDGAANADVDAPCPRLGVAPPFPGCPRPWREPRARTKKKITSAKTKTHALKKHVPKRPNATVRGTVHRPLPPACSYLVDPYHLYAAASGRMPDPTSDDDAGRVSAGPGVSPLVALSSTSSEEPASTLRRLPDPLAIVLKPPCCIP